MRKIPSILCLLVCILLILSACSTPSVSENIVPDPIAPESEMSISSSKTQVSEFVTKNKDFIISYDTDECYNITPDFIADNSDFSIFKYDTSTESFIMYDGEIYSIGPCLGGNGITSVALADLNRDGQYELYFAFSWGSGMHRSHIGYFNPINKEVTVFDYSLPNYDMMLTVNKIGDLCVNSAVIKENSFVDFSIKAQDLIGTIIFKGDEIMLNMD